MIEIEVVRSGHGSLMDAYNPPQKCYYQKKLIDT